LAPSTLNNIDVSLWVARWLRAQAAVFGKITNGFTTISSISGEMRNPMAKVVEYPTSQTDPTLFVSGKNGYTVPTCTHGPEVRYDDIAARNHTQGTVLLMAVVGVDGKAHDLSVIKP
jgi:hypothetical protein